MPRSNRSIYSRGGNNINLYKFHNLQKPIDVTKERNNMEECLEFYKEFIEPLLKDTHVVNTVVELNMGVEFEVDEAKVPHSIYLIRKMVREHYLIDIRRNNFGGFTLVPIQKKDLRRNMPIDK